MFLKVYSIVYDDYDIFHNISLVFEKNVTNLTLSSRKNNIRKKVVRIENMHVTYKVISGISKLFDRLIWKSGGLKHNRVYTSRIDNHTVRLIKKEHGYNFQVYVTKVLGESPKEAYHQARVDADYVACHAEFHGAKLSDGWVSSESEIAIPSPVASAILTTTEASQIRTNKGMGPLS